MPFPSHILRVFDAYGVPADTKDTLYDLLNAYATDRVRRLGGKAYRPQMAPVLHIEEARERLERMLGKISYWSALTRLLPFEWSGGSRRRGEPWATTGSYCRALLELPAGAYRPAGLETRSHPSATRPSTDRRSRPRRLRSGGCTASRACAAGANRRGTCGARGRARRGTSRPWRSRAASGGGGP